MTGRRTTLGRGVPACYTGARSANLSRGTLGTVGPAMPGIAVCKGVTNRTGAAAMLAYVVLARPVGEGRSATGRSAGEQGPSTIVRRAAVAIRTMGVGRGVRIQVTGAAVGRSAGRHGVGTAGRAHGMASRGNASRAVGGRFMGRAGIGEAMGRAAGIDNPVDMFGGVGKAGAGAVDVGMAGDALGRRHAGGMGAGRIAVAFGAIAGCTSGQEG